MTPREQLLLELFRRLEEQDVRYCVLRNFENVFVDLDTDVDLLVTEGELGRFRDCLVAAAAATDHQIIQQNRFVNFSYVLWNGGDRLVRIDVETEVRWRVFEVLSSEEVLAARHREGSFYVPHPNHEYVGLLLQTIWTDHLRDRYRDRLTALVERCQDIASLQAELVRALGPMGASLVDATRLNQAAAEDWLGKLRHSMIRKTLLTPSRALRSFRHFLTDARRLLGRLRRPPGVIVKVFAPSEDTFAQFWDAVRGFEFLFPTKKTSIHVVSEHKSWTTRWRDTLDSQQCLFKGGMDLQFHPVTSDADLSALITRYSNYRRWRPSRTFICLVDESGRGQLAHVGSGLMISLRPSEMHTDAELTARLVPFVCSMLDRPRASKSATRRGLFCVLVGLDGSGKTTLARNLAISSADNPHPRFRGVRYYHWLPRPWKPVELPFPSHQDVPHKPKYPASPVRMALSCVRLLRNLLWAHLAYALIVRRLRRENYLVLLDRYFYNYILDPSSLKYSAPTWLLTGALPLFPKPDAVILLKAGPSVLQSRKRELSPDEITAQTARLDEIKFYAPRCITLDASWPADRVASAAYASILEMASDHEAT
ncbi:MAG: hypothetical protein ABSD58_13095 [Verrucomicrobiia bacterium]